MLQFSGHYMKVNDKAIYWLDKNKSQKPKGRSQLYNARDRFIDSIMPQYYFSIEFIAKKNCENPPTENTQYFIPRRGRV